MKKRKETLLSDCFLIEKIWVEKKRREEREREGEKERERREESMNSDL